MKDFEEIINGSIPDDQLLIHKGVETAMTIREHHAAYRTPSGIGMVTPYEEQRLFGFAIRGVAAAIVTNSGEIIVEHHMSKGDTLEELDGTECRAYTLGPDNLTTLTDHDTSLPRKGPRSAHSQAYRFSEDISYALGQGPGSHAIAGTESGGREVVRDLIMRHDHSFNSRIIEELVYEAYHREE